MKQDWEYKKLGEVCEIFGRIGFRGYKREDYVESENEGAISLSPSNIIGGHLDYSKNTYISWYKYEESPEIKIYEGDVLLVKTASVGKSAIVETLPHAATINPQFVVLKKIQADNKYLYYTINSEWFLAQLKSITSGSSVPTLSQKALAELQIPLPPLSTQQSIVAELDEINNLLNLKRKELETYDKLAQSVFYEMFGDPVENEKGWEVKKLIELVAPECTISYGIVQPGDGVEDGIPVVRPIDLTGTFVSTYGLKKTTEEISNSYSRTILTGKELLVCVRGTTGVCSLATDELKGCNVTRGITPLLFSERVDRWFMYYQFQMPQIKWIIADYTKGITLKQINMADFRKIPVILPPIPLQQTFAARIEAIEEQKASVKAAIEKLETLLAARMQYWFE